MIALVKNEALQEQLNRDGFITAPFLSVSELEELRTFYDEIHPMGDVPGKIDGIHMTTWCEDFEYKMKVADFLSNLYQRASTSIFTDFRRLNDVFIVKDPGAGTAFKVHQDWNIVDEKENYCLNIWVPLYDVNEHTGGLWVVKGSHLIKRNVRGSGYLFPNYTAFFSELEEVATSVSLKAGEAIIFYMNAIHGSPPNLGENPRIATCFSVIPKEAQLHVYFQKNAGDPLEVHHPSDNFMYDYTHLRTESYERSPTNKAAELLPSYVNNPIDRAELAVYLKAKKKSSRFGKLFSRS